MLYSFYIQGANIFELTKYLILSGFLIGMTCKAQVKNFSFYGSANYPTINTVEIELQTIGITIPAATGDEPKYNLLSLGLSYHFSSV
jgi:hypothetical protein